MIKRVLFSIIIFLIPKLIFGQIGFYMDLSGTYPFIPKVEHTDKTDFTDIFGNPATIKLTEQYKVKPGLRIEMGFDKNVINKFSINSGIGLSFYQYKRESKLDFVDNNETGDIGYPVQPGLPFGTFWGYQPGDIHFQDIDTDLGDDRTVIGNPNFGETKILYLAIPVRFQYSLVPDKLKIGIGVTNYFVAYSSQIKTMIDVETQPYTQKEYNDKSSNGLNNYQLAGDITMEYNIFKGFWIKAGYGNSFSSIYDKPQPSDYQSTINDKAKYRTVLIGLKYRRYLIASH